MIFNAHNPTGALKRAKTATAEGRPAVAEAMTKVETEVPEKSV